MGGFKFCPNCGSAMARRLAEGRERDHCPACNRLWYENAKPCAGALVVEQGRLLLVKRAIAPHLGLWDIPGGFLEADEHPEAGAIREVREETGLDIALTGLHGVYVDTYRPGDDAIDWHHSLNFFYLARQVGGALAVTSESSDARWFDREALPPMEEIAYNNGRCALAHWLKLPASSE